MTRRWWTVVLAVMPLSGAWAQGVPQPGEAEEPGPAPARCVERALEELFLSQHESVLLCQGAESDEPVECFIQTSEQTFLTKTDILSLCSPTLSGGAVDAL